MNAMLFPTLISRLFDPFIELFILFGIAAYRSGVTGWNFGTLMGIIFFVVIVPPLTLLLWAVKTKRISNWDISNHKQRIRALSIFFIFLLIDFIVMQRFVSPLMRQVFFFFLIYFIGFFIITLFWKISGHTATLTVILCIFILWYGYRLWSLLFLIPLVGWSRIILKRHTIREVIGGVIYAVVLFGMLSHIVDIK